MTTPCGVCASLSGPEAKTPLYEDSLWHVRHMDAPYGVAGWMLLITKRHVAGPAHFNDDEVRAFGPALRHFSKGLEGVTGALRIYMAAMGESHPHFHCHLVPKYATTPFDAKAWGVFDLHRRAAAGELTVDPAEVTRISAAYAALLGEMPPPRV